MDDSWGAGNSALCAVTSLLPRQLWAGRLVKGVECPPSDWPPPEFMHMRAFSQIQKTPQIDPGLGPRADKRVKGGRGAEMGLQQQQRRLPRRLALLRLDGGNTEEGMESYYTLSDEWVSLEASSSLSSAAQSKSGDESMAQLVRVPVLVAATGAFPYNP